MKNALKKKTSAYPFIGFRPSHQMAKQVRQAAAKRGVKISQIVREAIQHMLQNA